MHLMRGETIKSYIHSINLYNTVLFFSSDQLSYLTHFILFLSIYLLQNLHMNTILINKLLSDKRNFF